jgi:drug/metabolite transporter (DMT)-like permease
MSARGWLLFASMSVIWGVPYMFIKIAVDELSAGFVAWSRVAMAAAILLPIAWRTGALRGLPLRWLVAFAFVEITIPFPLIAFGEEALSSSLTAILIAAVPLMVAFLALRFDHSERPTRTRLVGMLVGLTGVTVLVGIDVVGSTEELIGAAAILVATMGYAAGPMIVKNRFAAADPIGPIAGALGIATLLLLPVALPGLPTEAPSGDVLASMLVLGFVCTAIAFLIFFRLITEVGPGRATVITYINPVVALALGVAILGESVTAGAVVGLLLILAGSWLSTDGRLPPGLAGRVRGLPGVRRERAARPRPQELRA